MGLIYFLGGRNFTGGVEIFMVGGVNIFLRKVQIIPVCVEKFSRGFEKYHGGFRNFQGGCEILRMCLGGGREGGGWC